MVRNPGPAFPGTLARHAPELAAGLDRNTRRSGGASSSYVFEKIDKLINMLNGAQAAAAYLDARSSGK
jgi:hypothetical protein